MRNSEYNGRTDESKNNFTSIYDKIAVCPALFLELFCLSLRNMSGNFDNFLASQIFCDIFDSSQEIKSRF